MRSLIVALFLAAFVPGIAYADSERKATEARLFEMGMMECVKTVYHAGNGYYAGEDKGLVEACLLEKGVNLTSQAVGGGEEKPKTYHMGAGGKAQNQPKAITYQIGNMDAFAANLKNGGRAKTEPETDVKQELDKTSSKNSSSIQNKYYLPSGKSNEGPKPIFLNRKKK